MSARLGACAAVLVGILAAAGQARAVTASCLPVATGTIHYVCDCGTGAQAGCTVGSDSNNGTSTATPWRTLDKARLTFNAAAAGDQILFCQGGAFDGLGASGNVSWRNSNATAASPVSVGMYTTAWGGANPLIYDCQNPQCLDFEDGSDSHEEGYVFDSLTISGNGSGVGVYGYNDIDYVSLCNVRITGYSVGIQMEMTDGTHDLHNSNWLIHSSEIDHNTGQGMLGADNYLVIEYTKFHFNGSRDTLDHNLYLSAEATGADICMSSGVNIPGCSVTVRYCEFYDNDAYNTTVCNSASVVLHGHSQFGAVNFIGNYVHETVGKPDTCWGLTADKGDLETFKVGPILFQANVIENMGNLSMGCENCPGSIVENNVVINRNNVNQSAIAIPSKLPESAPDAISNNITVRNNSLVIDLGQAIEISGTGTGHVMANNAVYHLGTGTVSCFNLPDGTSAYTAVDYNQCFFANATTARWELSTTDTLAAWRVATGFDTHSLTTNPGFTNIGATTYNLAAPSSSSAMVGAGSVALGSLTDFNGIVRGAPVDIGAYEFQAPAQRDFGGANRPIMYGVWLCLVLVMLGSAGLAIHKAVKQKKSESLYLSDEFVVLALEEMRDDGIGFTDDELRREAVPRERKWRR